MALETRQTAAPRPTAVPYPGDATGAGAGLKANTLTLWDTTVIAVTSTAPAYSLAATMALIAGAVGLASPAAILASFVPVAGIAVAYAYFNKANPNCGASYAWLTQAMGPWLGWLTGWVQLAAFVFFLISAPTLAGLNTLQFLHSLGWISGAMAGNVWATAVFGIVWLLVVTAMVIYGTQLVARFQAIMLAIEYGVLVAFSALALGKVTALHPTGATSFSWRWLNPLSIQGVGGLAAGVVLAVFFFWGWDTAANVNEETQDARLNPGRAVIIGMFLLLFIFLLASSAVQALLPQKTIVSQGGNALLYFANALVPAPWSYLMLLAILSSTVATLQTTLLPATRLTLAMARDRVWPRAFSVIHPRYQTPVRGTLILAAVAALGLLLTTASPSVNATLGSLVSNIGVLVSFYYGITGIACAWHFRRVLTRDAVTLVFAGILPLCSGLFLFWVGYQVIVQGQQASGWGYVLPVLLSAVLGLPLVVIAWLANKTYFAYRPHAFSDDAAR